MNKFLVHEEFWDHLPELNANDIANNTDFLKSENRSSAIFPIFRDGSTKTKILLLSYWLKKHGNNVIFSITVRDILGDILQQLYVPLVELKALSYTVSDLFSDCKDGFCGSVEIEIFSKNKPSFNYPAISVAFENNESCSVVHSCIRSYNVGEKNSDYVLSLPQTGFDFEFSPTNKNFICFFGGKANEYKLEIILSEGNVRRCYSVHLKNECYCQSHILFLEDIVPRKDYLKFNSPRCKIIHNLKDIFPRFYVGIHKIGFIPTLTHTFFDTSRVEASEKINQTVKLRVANKKPDEYFDSAFSVPIYPITAFSTSLRSYAQNLQFKGEVLVTVYSKDGDRLVERSLNSVEVDNLNAIGNLDLKQFIIEPDLPKDRFYSLHFAFFDKKQPFPLRFKLGFNLKKSQSPLGSNICFSPVVMSEKILAKPFNRRWFPVGGSSNYIASLHTTSLSKFASDQKIKCVLEFVNHQGNILIRNEMLKNNASIFIDTKRDKTLDAFLNGQEGWCMVTSNTYLCDAYYFGIVGKQIGGDHAF